MSAPDYSKMFTSLAKAISTQGGVTQLEDVYEQAKASSDSVIAQTEYQDGKIIRILTVVAFLSAAVSTTFTRFQPVYAWNPSWNAWLVDLSYILFFVYCLLVAIAATILLVAIRPRFNVPKSWSQTPDKAPESLFFYQKILEVSPEQWATFWTHEKSPKARASAHYIGEAYLVADKIQTKLRLADTGVAIFIGATGTLIAVFLAVTLTFVFVKPDPTAAVQNSGNATAPPSPSPSPRPSPTPTPRPPHHK